jgi:hypothetical protein
MRAGTDTVVQSRLAWVTLAVGVALAAPRANAQAVIKVTDDVNFRFGFLIQPQADWLQDATTEGYAQNLFLRRVRLLVGGNLAKSVSFFFETDNPNLGKVGGGTKTISSGLVIQDAYLTWKLRDEFMVDGGLILTGIAHNSLQGATSLMAIDYGAYSFLYSTPEQNVVGRDTGFQLRGYPIEKKLEYRVGVWQGARDAAGRQAYRGTARVQCNFFEADTGFFYSGTSFGKKKILAVGGGVDFQKDYLSYAGDVYFDHPLGPGALSAQLDYVHYDGGTFLTTLKNQSTIYGEAGYYISSAKIMPFFTYGRKDVAETDNGDESRWAIGIGYIPAGHNFNVKAAYGRISPNGVTSTNQFTIQIQGMYF